MNRILLLILFSSFCIPVLVAQNNYTISGTIKDIQNGETFIGATVFIEGVNKGAVTNEYGFYSLTAPEGEYTLVFSYIGYGEVRRVTKLDKDIQMDVELGSAVKELVEVVVKASASEESAIQKPEMGVNKLSAAAIKKVPVVMGESDLVKSIQLLPGVTNAGEGAAGFNVRGGAEDQNLVLLDEAIIFNGAHLFGLVSIFNTDAIKDIKLYKGGVPARFGGRASSVLDVRQKDGNSKELEVNGGLGLVSSRLTLQAPLFKDKGSFLVAGRTSYAQIFMPLIFDEDNTANFYDLNLKANYKINQNNRIYLSGYLGNDRLDIEDLFQNNYGNTSINLRWNHLFSDKLFSNLSLIYSNYDYQQEILVNNSQWQYDIDNYNLKYDFKYYLTDKMKLSFGASTIYYDFNPGVITPTTDDSNIPLRTLDKKYALESGIYIGSEHTLTDKWSVSYGARLSHFARLGDQTINLYENNSPLVYNDELGIYEEGRVIGQESFGEGEVIEQYANIEPRIALSYQLNTNTSFKASYNKMSQYLHLISNTASASPTDVWVPSGTFIKPQLANQYAIGFFKNLYDNNYSLEVESYFKTVDNRLDYINSADLVAQNTIETEILTGESRSYGVEFLLKKNKGSFTGWLAYTLSKSEQRTPGGEAGGLGINNGNWYNTAYDRTHDISIAGNYQLTEKWNIGANFIFQTGRPVTYPSGQFQYQGLSVPIYTDRNEERLPAYHRLDVSATYQPRKNNDKKWQSEWVFGIYNIYNRTNAQSISFEQNRETGQTEAVKTYIFGILPSIAYNFKF